MLIPRKNVTKPAVIIELKYDDTAETAISQIHQRRYLETVQEYTGDLLLVEHHLRPQGGDPHLLH